MMITTGLKLFGVTHNMVSSQLNIALDLLNAGIACIPTRIDQGREKSPNLKWKQYCSRKPTPDELQSWFVKSCGIAAICGSVSDNLECLDFETVREFNLFADEIDLVCPSLLRRLVQVRTPSGGTHLWYRCDVIGPNQKLAFRDSTPAELECNPNEKVQLLIETRGEGGYALIPGGDPKGHPLGIAYEYITGSLTNVQRITPSERETLLNLARSFNRVAKPTNGNQPSHVYNISTIDDYDKRGSWQQILEPHGWRLFSGDWESEGRLTRPGKESGVSATIGYCRGSHGEPLLHVFTTATILESGTYGKFRAFAILNNGGNFSETAKLLAREGYGTPYQRGHQAMGPQPRPQVKATEGQKGNELAKLPWEVPPQKGERPRKLINAVDLIHKEFVQKPYTVEGILSQGLNLIGGKPKAGKSWFALQLAWAVAGGYELSGRKVRNGSVLYLALEDTEARLQSRMKLLRTATNWDYSPKLELATVWPRCDDSGLYYICEWIEARKNDAVLVIVDTLQKFRKPIKGQTNNYSDDYEALEGLKGLCDLYGVTSLVMHHTRKLKAEDPFEELSGTQGLAGAADGLGVLDRDRSNATGRLYITGRDQGDSTTQLSFSRETGLWTLGETTEGIDSDGRTQHDKGPNKVEQCVLWLKEFLREFAYPSAEIEAAAKDQGFTFDNLKTAKARLGKNGSGELCNHNFGGNGANDWWSGLGPYRLWIKRPDVLNSPQSPQSPHSPRKNEGEANI